MKEQSDTPRIDAQIRSFLKIAPTDAAAGAWLDGMLVEAKAIERALARFESSHPRPRGEGEIMTDHEMLELAAKAAGLNYDHRYGIVFGEDDCGNATEDGWNPLLDDGDALRLAVKLGLHVMQYPIYDEPKHSAIAKKSARLLDDTCVDMCVGIEVYGSDPYAATRRAIVRAAAEIGQQMEVTK